MRQGMLYGVMAGALWGMIFLAPALIPDFSALQTSAGRYTAYGLVSLIAALPSARTLFRKVRFADVLVLTQLALFGNLIYYCLLVASVRHVGIAPASLIIGTLPVTITLLGSRAHGALPLKRLALPLLVVLAGIVCINVDVFTHQPALSQTAHTGAISLTASTGTDWRHWLGPVGGVFAALSALACWTWYALANTKALHARPQFSGNEWSLLWGIASGALGLLTWLVLLCLPSHIGTAIGVQAMPAGRWRVFWEVNLALALAGSLLGNALWNAASRRLPMTLMGQMIVFETLFALLYGFIYAMRLPNGLEAAAIVLLMTGVIWSVRLHAKDDSQTPGETLAESHN